MSPYRESAKPLETGTITTIIHGADKIAKEVLVNETTKNTVDILIKKIDPS